MARGLSDLQKEILKIAYRNRDRTYVHGNVTNRQVLIEVYHFPAHPPAPNSPSGTPQSFNRREIGINKYKAASVSVEKAFDRLVKRGLALRKYYHGIILTEAGAKVFESLCESAGIKKTI